MVKSLKLGRPLHYGRHFALLIGFAAVLIAFHGRVALGLGSFGFYGALHATALVAALRLPAPVWRRLAFVLVAAGLSLLSAWFGIHGRGFVGVLSGKTGAGISLTFSSAAGAASYALAIRYFWIRDLSFRAVAATTLGCAATTLGVFGMAVFVSNGVGATGLALSWWFAFSLFLWRCRPAGFPVAKPLL